MESLLFQFFPRKRERERGTKKKRVEERRKEKKTFDWVKRKLKTYFSQKFYLHNSIKRRKETGIIIVCGIAISYTWLFPYENDD